MKLSDYIEKKKELEEAKNKMKEAENAFNKEKQVRRQELVKKVDPMNFKSWVKSDIGVVILVLILFGVVQFQLSSLQVSDLTENVEEDSVTAVAAVVDDTIEEEPVEAVEEVVEEVIEEPEIPETVFSLETLYNNEDFSKGDITGGEISYDLVIENLMGSDISCSGSEYKNNVKTTNDFSLSVKLVDKTRRITTKVVSDPGEVKVQHKVTCYVIGTNPSEGTERTHAVNLNFI